MWRLGAQTEQSQIAHRGWIGQSYRSRAVNFPTHHPNSRARESSANMGTCIVRTIWFESQSGSHWQRGDTRTAAFISRRGHGFQLESIAQ